MKGKVQYGPRVRSLINYSLVYQYLPYKRLQELFRVCFGLHISQGTIFNTTQRTADNMQHLYNCIKDFISKSDIVGADETIVFVKGNKWYDWVWQNKQATFIACEPNRKKENIAKYFPHGFPNSILISDRYSSHLNTPAKAHQICWAHLIRKLNFIDESEPNKFAHQLIDIYRRAKHLQNLKSSKGDGSKNTRTLEGDLTRLLLKKH